MASLGALAALFFFFGASALASASGQVHDAASGGACAAQEAGDEVVQVQHATIKAIGGRQRTSQDPATPAFFVAREPAALVAGIQVFTYESIQNGQRPQHYSSLLQRATTGEFASAGFSHVWLPPPSQGALEHPYQPGEWYTIPGQSTLLSLTQLLSKQGISPVCDMVLNHRTGSKTDPCNAEYVEFRKPAWSSNFIVRDDWKDGNCVSGDCAAYCNGDCVCGNADTGENFYPNPDVDHTKLQVQDDIVAFMAYLRDEFSFAGWRFDFAKGYAPKYVKQYVEKTGALFAVGEYLEYDTEALVSWVWASGQNAFDFPQRGALKSSIQNSNFAALGAFSKQPGLSGVEPTKAQPFIENHDTTDPGGQAYNPFGSDYDKMLGYAYILTHPPFPWVYMQDFDGVNGENIKLLTSIRRDVHVSPADKLYISGETYSKAGLYAAFVGAQEECNGKLAIKLGPTEYSPCGEGWKQVAQGEHWKVWTK